MANNESFVAKQAKERVMLSRAMRKNMLLELVKNQRWHQKWLKQWLIVHLCNTCQIICKWRREFSLFSHSSSIPSDIFRFSSLIQQRRFTTQCSSFCQLYLILCSVSHVFPLSCRISSIANENIRLSSSYLSPTLYDDWNENWICLSKMRNVLRFSCSTCSVFIYFIRAAISHAWNSI